MTLYIVKAVSVVPGVLEQLPTDFAHPFQNGSGPGQSLHHLGSFGGVGLTEDVRQVVYLVLVVLRHYLIKMHQERMVVGGEVALLEYLPQEPVVH